MAGLHSAHWYRIAELRLSLKPHVAVQCRPHRGQRWYLVSDSATGRQHRIDEAAYQFIGRCDRKHSVQEVWAAVLNLAPEDAPTQDEIIELLGQLHLAGLIHADHAGDLDALLQRRRARKGGGRLRNVNPLAFQWSLGNPDPWLARLDGLARALFNPWMGLLWLGFVLLAAWSAATRWPSLKAYAELHLWQGSDLLILWLGYPLMKAAHELGHALAVRRWGGEVTDAGIGLLLLTPAPYVNASAATNFPRRFQRAAVGAAGILVELALAALAWHVWANTQDGLLRQAAFAVMVLGTGSALLFNGNPLMRFDAYHVLCDVIEMPNLATRSAQWWWHRLGRLLAGAGARPPAVNAGESGWLVAYAPLSLACRVALSWWLVVWLASLSAPLAVLAAVVMAGLLFVWPLRQWVMASLSAAAPGRELAGAKLRLAGVAAAGIAAVALIPLPHHVVVPAVVWLPEQAQVRAEVEGFVEAVEAADGAAVGSGDLLVRLQNDPLRAEQAQLASRLEALEVEHFQQLLRDPTNAQNVELDLTRTRQDLALAERRVEQLSLRADVAARLVMPRQADLPGRWIERGTTLGYLFAPQMVRVRAVVPEADAPLIRNGSAAARVRLADDPSREWHARPVLETPAATRQLPSAALGLPAGGSYAVDPAQADGLLSLQPVVLLDLLVDALPLERVGARAWARFELADATLLQQAWRRVSQVFLGPVTP